MTPWVRRLIIANVAIFFVQYTMGGAVDALLAFVPYAILVRPWTLVTYMFLHGGVMHILFNMLTLYFFGPRVEARLGERRFITLYLISGVAGALLSFALAPHAALVGASAAIFGVMLAFAYYWPHDKIFIWGVLPIEARWMVVLTTVMALVFAKTGIDAGTAHYAHLGGYAGGGLYLWWLARTRGTTAFKARVVPSVPERTIRDLSNLDLRGIHELNREELNRILDKINATGVNSLTPTEKTFLASFVPKDDRRPVS
jgi:membrane associated rhomboid family serine protease